MIFLSYTQGDSEIVDPVASAIGQHFGQANVFFDKWSIFPGESIIARMNEGLANCAYFFLFMTKDSMAKAFVNLEWHSALSMATQGGIARLVPIRASETHIPPILAHLKYIDMYTIECRKEETVAGLFGNKKKNKIVSADEFTTNLLIDFTECTVKHNYLGKNEFPIVPEVMMGGNNFATSWL